MSPFGKIAKLFRLRFGLPFVRRADRARGAGAWIDAVIDYRRGLEWMPWRKDLLVQIGNCLKEFGDYEGAIQAYAAVTAEPSRCEALKQAADASRRAGIAHLPFAIAATADAPERSAVAALPPLSPRLLPNRIALDPVDPRGWLGTLGHSGRGGRRLRGVGLGSIKFDQVGAMVMQRAGAQEPLLAGVIAVRGRIWAIGSLDEAELSIGEGADAVRVAVPLRAAGGHGPLRLHVFNLWLDSAGLSPGRHWLGMRAGPKLESAGLFVNVADAVTAPEFASSNSFVASTAPFAGTSGGDVDRAVIAAPAEIRSSARTLFDRPIRSILALRVDQLGDVSASLGALRRLRGLFPDARLTVLAQAGVQAMIESSAVADEVLPIVLDYDALAERRRLDRAEETRLRLLLAERDFDLAIDLSPGHESRPLLLLTGAVYLVGFNPDRFTFLDFGIDVRSRDKINQLERLSHAAAVTMLIEALAVAIVPARAAVARSAPPRAPGTMTLPPQGYVVLHSGARHALNRWPVERFAALCEMLVEQTALEIVLFAGNELAHLAGPRVHLLDLIDPAAFDAIVSDAKAFVGNDSGPKHLAATRGVPTVSVHVDRLNWNEWGQEGVGAIVSKRVPCTGCGLNDIDLCGRDAICLSAITAQEVLTALRPYL